MRKKTLSKKKWKWKGLSLMQNLVLSILLYIYYYGLLCVAAISIVIVMVIWTGNFQPIYDLKFTEIFPVILGAVVFFPMSMASKSIY